MVDQIVSVTYSLQERNPDEISNLWQLFQILFFICSMVSSFVLIFYFSDVIEVLKGNCVLNSYLTFIRKSDFTMKKSNNFSCSIDLLNSKFDNRSCEIVTFVPVFVLTLACFFTCMFITCGRGGAGRQIPDAWRIVIPTILVNLFLCFLTLYAAIAFHNGVHIFFQNIQKSWGLYEIKWSDIYCLESEGKQIGQRLANDLQRVMEYSWLTVTFCVFGLFWIVLRLLFGVDFQLIKTTTFSDPRVDSFQKTVLQENTFESDGEKDFNQELSMNGSSDSSEDTFYTALSEHSKETFTSPSTEQRRSVHFREDPSVYNIFD